MNPTEVAPAVHRVGRPNLDGSIGGFKANPLPPHREDRDYSHLVCRVTYPRARGMRRASTHPSLSMNVSRIKTWNQKGMSTGRRRWRTANSSLLLKLVLFASVTWIEGPHSRYHTTLWDPWLGSTLTTVASHKKTYQIDLCLLASTGWRWSDLATSQPIMGQPLPYRPKRPVTVVRGTGTTSATLMWTRMHVR